MDRRAFLAAIAGSLTGCTAATQGPSTPTPTRSPVETVSETPTPEPVDAPSLAELGNPPTICASDIVDLGIYAIEDPAFAADWSGVDIPDRYTDVTGLDDAVVIGLERDDWARAYPVPVLWYHEIINDVIPPTGHPILVTFCSLCRSGMVAERTVGGAQTAFGVSGQLWQPPELEARVSEDQGRVFAVEQTDPDPGQVRNTGNLVMFDTATGSYWSQLLARAICGPREGDSLTIEPSTTARWRDWKADHPGTDVLLPPPHSTLQHVPG